MLLPLIWCLLVALFVLLCVYSCWKPKDYPPGPFWLPVIGCLFDFQSLKNKCGYTHLAFEELSAKYGPILGLKLGRQRLVVISTFDLVKKVLLQEEFNGRPDGFFFRVRSFGERRGVLFSEGSKWSQHRRFTMRHLRLFGLGQPTMVNHLSGEAFNLIKSLDEQSKRGAVPMHTAFDVAVLNSLWTLFAGHRFHHHDTKVKEILEVVHEAFRLMDTMGGLMSQVPFLRFVIPKLSGYTDLMAILEKLWEFLGDEIIVHEKELPNNPPRDLIDTFLLKIITEEKNADNTTDTIYTREELLILCLDLFMAGSKTTADTLSTIFMFLALNPEWIRVLQEEIDLVVGKDRLPRLEDRTSLPMVEAFLAEAQRSLLMAPLGVPHKTVADVTLNGYKIPKDTIVLLNYHSAQNDVKYWKDPEKFNPQRFIDATGQFQQNNSAIPFGLGKRRCLGELLARSTLFLFFTHVIHHFDFDISTEHGPPDSNSYDGFTVSPKPYYLDLTLRHDYQQISQTN